MEKSSVFFADNIKFLRERKKKTQSDLAEALGITRAKLNAIENNVTQNPTISDLEKMTRYFKISVDSLLWVNLKRLTELQLRNLEAGNDEYVMGTRLRVLATTINQHQQENIEIVPLKTKAGYTLHYSDPEFIASLPSFHCPILSENRKYRMFQLDGDSMWPIPDKAYVVAEFISDWTALRVKDRCVILTKNEGLVFKEIGQHTEEGSLILHSLHPDYKDYQIAWGEIREIWKFKAYWSEEIPEGQLHPEQIEKAIETLKKQLFGK